MVESAAGETIDAGKSPTIAHPAAPLAACDRNQQKLVVMATSLEGSKSPFEIDHVQP